MPKKTKKEKIISEYRKRIRLLQQYSSPESTQTLSPTVSEVKKPANNHQQTTVEIHVDEKELQLKTFFFKDLKRSALFISLIIALEIIIYFGTISNYFKF